MKKLILLIMVLAVSLFAKVDINKADVKELSSIKGIGAKKAQMIVEYRQKHPFTKIEDIMKVKGIGKKMFEKIKSEIEVKE